jgi:hypothetical protein
MTLALYTCFFGTSNNWANVIAEPVPGIDCYYITNNPDTYARLASTAWKRIWSDALLVSDIGESARQSKRVRCLPHEIPELRSYEYLVWMDSKLRITESSALLSAVQDLRNSSAVWAFTRHPLSYTSVWGEYHEAIQHEKYAVEKDRYHAYIESRLKAGYKESVPQRVCCGFSIRKQGRRVDEIGSEWFNEIQECGIEDQISFQFVHQDHEEDILLLPYQACWTYVS